MGKTELTCERSVSTKKLNMIGVLTFAGNVAAVLSVLARWMHAPWVVLLIFNTPVFAAAIWTLSQMRFRSFVVLMVGVLAGAFITSAIIAARLSTAPHRQFVAPIGIITACAATVGSLLAHRQGKKEIVEQIGPIIVMAVCLSTL